MYKVLLGMARQVKYILTFDYVKKTVIIKNIKSTLVREEKLIKIVLFVKLIGLILKTFRHMLTGKSL